MISTSANLFALSLAVHATHKIAGAKQFLICLWRNLPNKLQAEKKLQISFFFSSNTKIAKHFSILAIDFPRSGGLFRLISRRINYESKRKKKKNCSLDDFRRCTCAHWQLSCRPGWPVSIIGQREEFRGRANCFLIGPLVARLGIEEWLGNLRDVLDASECGNECLEDDHHNPRQAFLGILCKIISGWCGIGMKSWRWDGSGSDRRWRHGMNNKRLWNSKTLSLCDLFEGMTDTCKSVSQQDEEGLYVRNVKLFGSWLIKACNVSEKEKAL